MRGVDDEGHVANFVETEQLVTMDRLSQSLWARIPEETEGEETLNGS